MKLRVSEETLKSGRRAQKKGREFDPRPLDNCKAIQEQQTQYHHSMKKGEEQ
jgi:hypothetical protein